MRSLLAATALLATALPAAAVQVRDCDEAAKHMSIPMSIAEPWEKNARTFANGTIRVALLDTGGEPACCSAHLLIIAPDMPSAEGVEGARMCDVVSDQKEHGFESIDFRRLKASYDPKRGLLLTFPYQLYVDGVTHRSGVARVRVSVANATVTPE